MVLPTGQNPKASTSDVHFLGLGPWVFCPVSFLATSHALYASLCLSSPDAWCFLPCLPSPLPIPIPSSFFFIHHHLLHHLLSALAQIYYLLSLSLDGPTFCIDCYNNIGTVYFNLIVSILAQFFSFLGEEIFFTCKVIRKCLLNE